MKRLLALAVLLTSLSAQALTHGPLRGHADATTMHVWARAAAPGEFTLTLTDGGGRAMKATAVADPARDGALHFAAAGLAPATAYAARITAGERVVFEGASWTTGPADTAVAATVAFGSCAHEKAFPEQPIWARIVARRPQALVLLGDTPYIDLGTTEARRRRHREFFGFEPVRAALAAIPTWTTWDDHDYTANDEFGGVPGSETARPVFVEYHAHASFGDGERGIHTRFRQGPIEVFVLDTRSFADSGPSPLAVGERTLLGAQQIEWLQRGLLASNAPCKVLACGMVWNGGVRTGKKDCWGNWLAERDALFRWLGTQGIDGVVLVGGDVHRSRVIVHPTKALAGYDLVEFVSSPLAQNVIETNKVDVPGLAFDAGEPSSCLFLAVDAGVLRATFAAGDGRDFHHREIALASLQRADAAPAYRRAVAAMREAFGERYERMPDPDPDAGVEASDLRPIAAVAASPAWREALAAGAPALATWAKALQQPTCRFRPSREDAFASEFVPELFLGVLRLHSLLVARFHAEVAARDAAAAGATAAGMLQHALHLQQEPAGMAWAVAATAERLTVAMLRELEGAFGHDAGALLRARIRAHLAARGSFAAVSAAVRIEAFRAYDGFEASVRGKDNRSARAVREFASEMRAEFTATLAPLFAAGDAVDAARFDATLAVVAHRSEELRSLAKELGSLREQLEGDGPVDASAAKLLGRVLASLLCPSLHRLLEEHRGAFDALREAAG